MLFLGGVLTIARAADTENFQLWIQAAEMAPLAESREEQIEQGLMWTRRGQVASGAAPKGCTAPLRTMVTIPKDGRYTLWARYEIHPVRRKTFSVVIQGQEIFFATEPFGETPEDRPEIYQGREPSKTRMIWTSEVLDLKAGEHEVTLGAASGPPNGRWTAAGHPPLVDALVLTNDPSFDPATY